MDNIYLVGFMGTGKSSVGKELVEIKNSLRSRGLAKNKQSKWQFVDLDDLVSLREQRRIVDIFAKEGEPYFRKIEKKTLKEVSKENNFVVACGGGIVIDKDNIKIMKQSGLLVCLAASPKVILKRVSGNTERPLLNVDDPLRRIELLLKMRSPYYMQADKLIDTSKLSIKQVAAKISRLTIKKK